MNEKLLSIIVVNYRSATPLRRFLDSLSLTSLSSEQYEIIISNNDASEKDVLDALAPAYPVHVIHNETNLGFGTASNRAVRASSGRYLLFCNPDTEFLSGDLRSAIKLFENDTSSIGIIGFRLVDGAGRPERWSVGTAVSLWEIVRNNIGCPPGRKLWKSNQAIEVGRVSGAALMIPSDVFLKRDGFDEDFFLYFEDADLCHRVRSAGHTVLFSPDIVLRHEGGHSMSERTEQKRRYYASQKRYLLKHRPRWESSLVSLLSRMLFR